MSDVTLSSPAYPVIATMQRTLFSRREAAKIMGVSTSTITRLIDAGELKIVRLGKRTLVPRSELDRFQSVDIPKLRAA